MANNKIRRKKLRTSMSAMKHPSGAAAAAALVPKCAIMISKKPATKHKSNKGTVIIVAVVAFLLAVGSKQSGRDAITNLVPYIYLQHPELVNRILPFANLRPSLLRENKRQVLIVGTMSSGTRQVVSDLQTQLGLEISHEASDASNYLVRDGTVSWFHGIRYLERFPEVDASIRTFCQHPTPRIGFHPQFYQYDLCEDPDGWNACWRRECERIVRSEWGCALSSTGCDISFQKILHQVRNPIKVIESLTVKFCSLNSLGRPGFFRVSKLMFGDFKDYTCLETVSHYVLAYTRAMINAREHGIIDAVYSIEHTSACEVAELAGFIDSATVVYEPNVQKVSQRCQSPKTRDPMNAKEKFKVNKERLRLRWSDLEGGKHGSNRPLGDMSLVQEVTSLMLKLGYDPDEI